jgi:hypothetical protein
MSTSQITLAGPNAASLACADDTATVYVWLPGKKIDDLGGKVRSFGQWLDTALGGSGGGAPAAAEPAPNRASGIDVGHAALTIGADCHLSLYPEEPLAFTEYLSWVTGQFYPELLDDALHMGRKPDFSCKFTELDAAAMRSFADAFKADKRYHLRERNCATAVGEAILAGWRGRNQNLTTGEQVRMLLRGSTWDAVFMMGIASGFAWTPELVKDFALTVGGKVEQ